MKRTIKSISFGLFLALFALPLIAQQRPNQRLADRPQNPRGDRMGMYMNIPADVRSEAHIAVFDEYLNLSDDQKTQLVQIDTDFAAKRLALINDAMSRDRRRIAMRDLRNEHQVAIHNILSKEQYSIFLEKRETIRAEVQQRLRAYNTGN